MKWLVWALLLVSTEARAEISVSLFAGPSIYMQQDVKYRVFDGTSRVIGERLVPTSWSYGFLTGAKLSYFFHENWGVESETTFGQTELNVDLSGTPYQGSSMLERRGTTTLSLLARRGSIYGGAGVGMEYASVENVGIDVEHSGQFMLGANFKRGPKAQWFLELKYQWGPDVGEGERPAGGTSLKTSGNPSKNPMHQLFGPHYDTQILSLVTGVRFFP